MTALDVRLERVAAARAALAAARALLLAPTPSALDACGQPLREAAGLLRGLEREEGRPELALGLERELAEIRGLLEQAGDYYSSWAGILHSMTGTYDAVGDLHAPGGATVSLDG